MPEFRVIVEAAGESRAVEVAQAVIADACGGLVSLDRAVWHVQAAGQA